MRHLIYLKRAQVLLSDEQFAVLQKLAKQQKRKLGTILRDAFDRVYVQRHREEQVKTACARLLSLKAPTTRWDRFERAYAKKKYG